MRVVLVIAVVASRFVDGCTGSGPTSPPSVEEASPTREAPSADVEEGIEAELDRSLRQQAMRRLGPRVLLRARARPDGTHVYRGYAFTATISADGHVSYVDRRIEPTFVPMMSDAIICSLPGVDPVLAERQRFEEDNADLIAGPEDASGDEAARRDTP